MLQKLRDVFIDDTLSVPKNICCWQLFLNSHRITTTFVLLFILYQSLGFSKVCVIHTYTYDILIFKFSM